MSVPVSRQNIAKNRIPTVLSSNLRLWDDQLHRVGVFGLVDRVIENADGLEKMTSHLNLAREVCWVSKDLAGLGLELHALALLAPLLHRSLDANSLVAFVDDLVDICVKHVSTSVDGTQASESLWQLAQSVKRVDVGRLAVPCHGVDIEADALHGVRGHTRRSQIVVRGVQGHAVTNEVTSGCLESKLVVDLLHRN